ncbi:LuxR family transcriptional regulator [Klebsiella pneumoniae]|uniref:LuxR family transcriptional regulator n=1 Tax=Klebsiella pneumoniae TaxID=573 RepID=A0A377WTN7_KLEPN|nr:LuxR family transcriptional regulator [Klebsiella pneumoniae]
MVILIFHFRNIGFPEKERMRGISYKPYPSRKIIVLRHLLEGASNFHIAAKMDISSKTVSTYKSRLMKKLNCQTLVELIGFANKFRIDESFISD